MRHKLSYFCIVGKNDVPLYELEFNSSGTGGNQGKSQYQLKQFILHASLDLVEESQWKTANLYLKNPVDRFNQYLVFGFVGAGNTKFLLLFREQGPSSKQEEAQLKGFFQDVYETYARYLLNPFYQLNSMITDKQFDSSVRQLYGKYFK